MNKGLLVTIVVSMGILNAAVFLHKKGYTLQDVVKFNQNNSGATLPWDNNPGWEKNKTEPPKDVAPPAEKALPPQPEKKEPEKKEPPKRRPPNG